MSPGTGELSIRQMALLFHAPEEECDESISLDCPCAQELRTACRTVEFTHGPHRERREDASEATRVSCVAVEEWPELYCGTFDTHVGPIGTRGEGRHEVTFQFPPGIGELEYVYLLCRSRSGSLSLA